MFSGHFLNLADEVFGLTIYISDTDSEDETAPHVPDLAAANVLLHNLDNNRAENSVVANCDSTAAAGATYDPARSGPGASCSVCIPYDPEKWEPDSLGSLEAGGSGEPAAGSPQTQADSPPPEESSEHNEGESMDVVDSAGPSAEDCSAAVFSPSSASADSVIVAPGARALPGIDCLLSAVQVDEGQDSASTSGVRPQELEAVPQAEVLCFGCLKDGHDMYSCLSDTSEDKNPTVAWPLRCPVCEGYVFRGRCYTCNQL